MKLRTPLTTPAVLKSLGQKVGDEPPEGLALALLQPPEITQDRSI